MGNPLWHYIGVIFVYRGKCFPLRQLPDPRFPHGISLQSYLQLLNPCTNMSYFAYLCLFPYLALAQEGYHQEYRFKAKYQSSKNDVTHNGEFIK
jgi:hypothetical protein